MESIIFIDEETSSSNSIVIFYQHPYSCLYERVRISSKHNSKLIRKNKKRLLEVKIKLKLIKINKNQHKI